MPRRRRWAARRPKRSPTPRSTSRSNPARTVLSAGRPVPTASSRRAPARVVIGVEDPDPRTAGRGIARLREAEVEIELLDSSEARASLVGYLTRDPRPPACHAQAGPLARRADRAGERGKPLDNRRGGTVARSCKARARRRDAGRRRHLARRCAAPDRAPARPARARAAPPGVDARRAPHRGRSHRSTRRHRFADRRPAPYRRGRGGRGGGVPARRPRRPARTLSRADPARRGPPRDRRSGARTPRRGAWPLALDETARLGPDRFEAYDRTREGGG